MSNQNQKLEQNLRIALYYFGFSKKKDISYNIGITKFYNDTKWLLFRAFGSKEGFMHIGLGKNNLYKKNCGYELFQPAFINKIIHTQKSAKNVLELGSGQGTNLVYLANKNFNITFWGIDLNPSNNMLNQKKNVHILSGDYHDLSMFPDNSISIIYAIETLCYAKNIEKVLQEAYRVLSKDGKLIIFDAYRKKAKKLYSPVELRYLKAIEEGFCLNQFQNIDYFNQVITRTGFTCSKDIDLKKYTIGYLRNLSARINGYLRLGIYIKVFLKLLPDNVLSGMKAGFLIEDSIRYNLTTYRLHILIK